MSTWKLIGVVSAGVLLALGFRPADVKAQPTPRELRADLQDLTTLDPEIERYLPRWRILEADLKIKLAHYFNLQGIPVSQQDSMIVTATFPNPETNAQELLSIRVGDNAAAVLSGTEKIRSELGEAQYQEILARDYQYVAIEPAVPLTEPERDRMPNVFVPANARQFVAVSAFRQTVQLGQSGARLEHMLGNDEIGYHFWTSGQGKAYAHYPIIPLSDPELRARGVPDIFTIDLGVAYRLRFGSPEDAFLGDIIAPRLLNGAIGPKAYTKIEFRLPQINDLGFAINAEVPFNKMVPHQAINANESIVSFYAPLSARDEDFVRQAYFLRTVAQGTLFWENWLGGRDNYEHFFRIALGLSYQEVALGVVERQVGAEYEPVVQDDPKGIYGTAIDYRGLIHPKEFEDWVYARVDYLNQSGFPFGVSAQIANRNLMLTGFVPVIRNWLFLEAKYTTPLLRDNPMPWEYPSFFMISPVLRFELE